MPATTRRILLKLARCDFNACCGCCDCKSGLMASPDVILVEETVQRFANEGSSEVTRAQKSCSDCVCVCVRPGESPFGHPRGINQVISLALLWSITEGWRTYLWSSKQTTAKATVQVEEVRKLVNMALYCTHNSSFPLFDALFLGGGTSTGITCVCF